MGTSRRDIERWLKAAQKRKTATHVIVICDTWDFSDKPILILKRDDVREAYDHYHQKNGYRVMEVYNLALPIAGQLDEHRAMHF